MVQKIEPAAARLHSTVSVMEAKEISRDALELRRSYSNRVLPRSQPCGASGSSKYQPVLP